jgi:CAAX prenyl protease-like protein
MIAKLAESPVAARVAPFVVFVLCTSLQGALGEASRFWVYLAKIFIGGWLVWQLLPVLPEVKWNWSWQAVAVGIAVLVMWIGLDPYFKHLPHSGGAWNPHAQFGPWLAWFFIVVRILGSSIVVPIVEEVFYRSFLYRYIIKPDFQTVPFGVLVWTPFIVTSIVFGFTHFEWLSGILCGFAFQGLVCWKKRLGDAIAAHAITNFLLGVWIVWKEEWHFW